MLIEPIKDADIAEVAALEAKVWGEAAASVEQIRARAQVFRDGSLTARLPAGNIVGYVVVQRVAAISTGSWAEQTDNGRLAATHRPDGRLLYGVNLSVLPEGARQGVSRALIEHCYDAFVARGPCVGICLGSRVPGFARWARENGCDIRRYLSTRMGGFSRDPELRLYEKNGFRLLWELKDYFEDPDSLDHGAMILRT